MLYCIIMKGSRTNSKYKDSHKKSEAKHLHAPARPTQFLAASDKRQSGISAQFACIKTHPNNTYFSQNNLGLVGGGLRPP